MDRARQRGPPRPALITVFQMHVSVAIVGYRNSDDIFRCLTALETSTHSDFDVFICENGGPEAFTMLAKRIPERLAGGQPVQLFSAPDNLGFGGGVNVCLEHTPTADAWWLLNPDTVVESTTMEKLVARLSVGDCDAVGCTIVLPDGTVQSHGGRWRSWMARSESLGHSHTVAAPVNAALIERTQNYLNGASMMVGRDFLKRTGQMRHDYFLYCEEVEWCLRGLSRGAKLGYAPDTKVLHYQGATTGSGGEARGRSRLPTYLIARNSVLLTLDRRPTYLPVALVLLTLQFLVRYGPKRAWRQLAWSLAGIGAGLLNRRGPPDWFNFTPPAHLGGLR